MAAILIQTCSLESKAELYKIKRLLPPLMEASHHYILHAYGQALRQQGMERYLNLLVSAFDDFGMDLLRILNVKKIL